MRKIRLSRDEKRLLRNVASGADYWPDGMGAASLAACADALHDAGLIDAAFSSGHGLVDALLTHKGAAYLQQNPHLRNPVNWPLIGSLAGIVAAIAALFVACVGL